jgi:hypothetical protein
VENGAYVGFKSRTGYRSRESVEGASTYPRDRGKGHRRKTGYEIEPMRMFTFSCGEMSAPLTSNPQDCEEHGVPHNPLETAGFLFAHGGSNASGGYILPFMQPTCNNPRSHQNQPAVSSYIEHHLLQTCPKVRRFCRGGVYVRVRGFIRVRLHPHGERSGAIGLAARRCGWFGRAVGVRLWARIAVLRILVGPDYPPKEAL